MWEPVPPGERGITCQPRARPAGQRPGFSSTPRLRPDGVPQFPVGSGGVPAGVAPLQGSIGSTAYSQGVAALCPGLVYHALPGLQQRPPRRCGRRKPSRARQQAGIFKLSVERATFWRGRLCAQDRSLTVAALIANCKAWPEWPDYCRNSPGLPPESISVLNAGLPMSRNSAVSHMSGVSVFHLRVTERPRTVI